MLTFRSMLGKKYIRTATSLQLNFLIENFKDVNFSVGNKLNA